MSWERRHRLRRLFTYHRWRFWRAVLVLVGVVILVQATAVDWRRSPLIVSGLFVAHEGTSLIIGHASAPLYLKTLLTFVPRNGMTQFPRAWVARIDAVPVAIIAGLLVSLHVIRRWNALNAAALRIRRLMAVGVCPGCGYDLAGLACRGTCPECGVRFGA